MSINRKKKQFVWRIFLVLGFLLELAFLAVAIHSLWNDPRAAVEIWQAVVFITIAVWIYIAYLKQRSMDISKFVVDEKIKTHSLINHLNEGILVIDPDMRLMVMNDRAVAALGIREVEWLGKDLRPALDPETVKFIEAGRSGETETKCAVSGKEVRFHVVNLPPGPDGESHKLVYVFEPVEASAEASGEEKRQKTCLEQAVAALSRAVEISAADVAGAAPDAARATVILQALAAETRLLDTVFEPPAQVGEQSAIGVEELVRESVAGLAHVLNAAGIGFNVSHADPSLRVFGNTGVLAGALRRVVLNAASGAGAGVIAVKTAAFGDKTGILIVDKGPTVSQDSLQELFERYYSGIKTAAGGGAREKGCGLFAARQIVEGADGILTAESRQDEGLRVTVMLPAALA